MNDKELEKTKIELIENDDLYHKQYNEETLSFNMERKTLTSHKIFQTQKNLSNEFLIKYIFNNDFAEYIEDNDITLNKIIGKFPNFAYFDPKTYRSKKN